MPKQRFELWRSEVEGSDSFFPAPKTAEERVRHLPPDAKLLWTTEAASWNEAQQKRYDFMGWGRYRRVEEDESA